MVYEVHEQIKNEIEEVDDCLIVTPTNPSPNQPSTTPPLLYSAQSINNQLFKRKRPNPSSNTIQNAKSTIHPQFTTKETLQTQLSSKEQPTTSATPANRSSSLQTPPHARNTAKDPQPSVSSTIETHDEPRPNSGEDDEIFARYITSELRQITDPHLKRVVKHKIQNIIFEAHCALQQK